MILACQNIEKSFGGVTLIQNASFHIEDHEKAAMVGINGAGKTTYCALLCRSFPLIKEKSFLLKENELVIWHSIRNLDTEFNNL